MPILNKVGIEGALSNYNAVDWSKSTKVDFDSEIKPIESKVLESPDMYGAESNKGSFAETLAKSIAEVNELQKVANTEIEKLVTGKSKNIHETMLAVEKADVAFRTMNQIRIKLLDSYKEIMKMQV